MLPWQQSAIYSYERKWNPRCVGNLHCECQEHKPKVEMNTSFLVLHPSSGVDTVKTVGSRLKMNYFNMIANFHLFVSLPLLDVRICGDNMAMQTVKYRQDKTKET